MAHDALWWHQARLLASSINRELKKAKSNPKQAIHRLDRAESLLRTLIKHISGRS